MNCNKENESYEVDLWRDTPVRLLGYANEVGESFRTLINVNWVRLSYGISFGYVLADTRDKTLKVKSNETNKIIQAATDTLIWQTLASVAIPGYTINRVCALTMFLLRKGTKIGLPARKWTTTVIGLGCIPFIVHPIDKLVDAFMDSTFRIMFPSNR